jgi:hypothetical protein
MKPDRYEHSDTGPQRLSGSLQQRGAKMGMPTWGAVLFGIPFVGVGAFLILVGARIVPVNPSSVHAPYWVLGVAGGAFACGGLMVWSMAWRQFAAARQRRQAAAQRPNEPALADYRWDPRGFEVSQWAGALRTVAIALGLSVFLSMFNWWAFGQRAEGLVKAVVVVFDCVAVALWCSAVLSVGRALKFGHSRIVFTRFPYELGTPVLLRWRPSAGIDQVSKGTFTLRCVEEWTETTGSGKNRHTTLIHEELWSAKWMLEQPRRLAPKDDVELSYEVPSDAPPTQLTADRPRFWELEVKLDLPGLDFKATYLVPIYGAKTTPRIKPIVLNR